MWRFAAARATGTSHLQTGTPCQDRLACAVLANGALVAAVSDGAGSAPRAEVGAEIAVQAVTGRLGGIWRRQMARPCSSPCRLPPCTLGPPSWPGPRRTGGRPAATQ